MNFNGRDSRIKKIILLDSFLDMAVISVIVGISLNISNLNVVCYFLHLLVKFSSLINNDFPLL